jgi:hypothetical protein
LSFVNRQSTIRLVFNHQSEIENDSMDMTAWLARATADADARGLPELKPLLETLARSTQTLRDADGEFNHPAAAHTTADQSNPSTWLGAGNDIPSE